MDAKKILQKIKKLLTQSSGEKAVGNEKAADNFALKAQELLSKYKLSLSDLDYIKEEESNPLTYEILPPEAWGSRISESRVEVTEVLAATLAEAYYCKVLALEDSNGLLILGRKLDIEIAKAILSRVIRDALTLCEIELAREVFALSETPGAAKAWVDTNGNEEFRYSFFAGYNARIAYRLQRKLEIIKEQSGSGGGALVRATKDVNAFAETFNPNNNSPLRERAIILDRAFNSGLVKGDKAEIFPLFEEKVKKLGEG